MSLRNARTLQILGLVLALTGLAGYWLNRDIPDKANLSPEQLNVLGIAPAEKDEVFHASFVVAGRDYDYTRAASGCRWVKGQCVRERAGEFVLGNRTDTIIYVNIIGNKITMINIPRDIYLPQWQAKINEMYAYQGAEGLKDAVEAIVEPLPVDYYAVIDIDIFKDLVDSLGGVTVNIPYPMDYDDAAADLHIHFKEGPTRLDGEDAAKFVRYRHTLRGDIDRIDNVKRLAYALLAQVKALNVRAAFKAPELFDAVFNNIETNASPALVRSLLPRLSHLQLNAASLPTLEVEGKNRLTFDPEAVEGFLADTFGGKPRLFTSAPEATLLVTNSSGDEGLEDLYRARLVSLGVPAERIVIRAGSFDPTPTRLLTTSQNWQVADYYTSLLQTSKQQIDRFDEFDDREIDVELVLGEDAAASALAKASRPLGITTTGSLPERGD